MPPFQALLARVGVEEYRGASDARIGEFERTSGLTLPPEVRTFFRTCDGAEVEDFALRLLPLSVAGEYAMGMRESGVPEAWGYLPLADADDSNPLCVCCASPLAGYVVHVFHDDAPRLAYRNVENFLSALAIGVEAFQGDVDEPEDADEEDEIPGGDVAYDFSGPERTTDDIAIGRRLIERAHALGDPDPETPEYIERGDAFRFGMALLSSAEVSDVAALLSVPDEHVQQAARDRLEEIGGPEAESALRAYDEQFARYVTESADRLRAAGLTATADGDALRVVEGNLSLNMPVFFARRHATDADVQFLDMVKRLAESRRDRAPQKKKGHRGKR